MIQVCHGCTDLITGTTEWLAFLRPILTISGLEELLKDLLGQLHAGLRAWSNTWDYRMLQGSEEPHPVRQELGQERCA